MSTDQEVERIAAAVYLSVGLFRRRLRQVPAAAAPLIERLAESI